MSRIRALLACTLTCNSQQLQELLLCTYKPGLAGATSSARLQPAVKHTEAGAILPCAFIPAPTISSPTLQPCRCQLQAHVLTCHPYWPALPCSPPNRPSPRSRPPPRTPRSPPPVRSRPPPPSTTTTLPWTYRTTAYPTVNLRCGQKLVLTWDGMLHNVLLDTTGGVKVHCEAASAVMATLPCRHVAVLLRCHASILLDTTVGPMHCGTTAPAGGLTAVVQQHGCSRCPGHGLAAMAWCNRPHVSCPSALCYPAPRTSSVCTQLPAAAAYKASLASTHLPALPSRTPHTLHSNQGCTAALHTPHPTTAPMPQRA